MLLAFTEHESPEQVLPTVTGAKIKATENANLDMTD